MSRKIGWLGLALVVVLSLASCKRAGPIYGTWTALGLDTLQITTTSFTKTTFAGTGFVATVVSVDESAGHMLLNVTSSTGGFPTGAQYILYSIANDDSMTIAYGSGPGYPTSTTDGPYTRQ